MIALAEHFLVVDLDCPKTRVYLFFTKLGLNFKT